MRQLSLIVTLLLSLQMSYWMISIVMLYGSSIKINDKCYHKWMWSYVTKIIYDMRKIHIFLVKLTIHSEMISIVILIYKNNIWREKYPYF